MDSDKRRDGVEQAIYWHAQRGTWADLAGFSRSLGEEEVEAARQESVHTMGAHSLAYATMASRAAVAP